MYISGSATSNFANVPVPPGHTAFLYFTIADSIGATMTWGADTGSTLTLVGSSFTAGQTYYVAYSKNGSVVQSSIPVTATANGSQGEIDPPTPFNNISLSADDRLGIVVAQ